jgi:hypothetical protein
VGRRAGVARHFAGQVGFLLGGEEEIAVGFDGQVLATFLLESAIGTALTVERVEVVGIELRIGERPRKVPALIVTEKVRVAEVKLGRALRVRFPMDWAGADPGCRVRRLITYRLEGKQPGSVDLDLPDLRIHVVFPAEKLQKFNVGPGIRSERG